MNKIIPLFLFLIIVFPTISAIEINMNSDISKGETILASVSGNFFDTITKDNIYFYRGHVRTSFDYDVAKIGDIYYIYIQTLNKAENNYSINISGVHYFVGSQLSDEQLSKSFKIINETADFSVNPGFILTSKNFSFDIQNIQASPITINLETELNLGSPDGIFRFFINREEITQSLTLLSGEIKTLNIQLEDISETTLRTITLSTGNTKYKIPCYIVLENVLIPSSNENTTESNQTDNETSEEDCSFLEGLFGTCETEDFQNETQENETSDNSSNADYEVIKQGNKTVVIQDGKVLNETATMKNCSQINGKICASGEVCQNTTIYAKDAKCCISECVKEKKANTKAIGWTIVGFIVIMILWFFFKKFRGMRTKKDNLLNSKK